MHTIRDKVCNLGKLLSSSSRLHKDFAGSRLTAPDEQSQKEKKILTNRLDLLSCDSWLAKQLVVLRCSPVARHSRHDIDGALGEKLTIGGVIHTEGLISLQTRGNYGEK